MTPRRKHLYLLALALFACGMILAGVGHIGVHHDDAGEECDTCLLVAMAIPDVTFVLGAAPSDETPGLLAPEEVRRRELPSGESERGPPAVF